MLFDSDRWSRALRLGNILSRCANLFSCRSKILSCGCDGWRSTDGIVSRVTAFYEAHCMQVPPNSRPVAISEQTACECLIIVITQSLLMVFLGDASASPSPRSPGLGFLRRDFPATSVDEISSDHPNGSLSLRLVSASFRSIPHRQQRVDLHNARTQSQQLVR